MCSPAAIVLFSEGNVGFLLYNCIACKMHACIIFNFLLLRLCMYLTMLSGFVLAHVMIVEIQMNTFWLAKEDNWSCSAEGGRKMVYMYACERERDVI